MAIRSQQLKIIIILVFFALGATDALSRTDKPPSCSLPEYRQFDFWIGDWDVFEPNSSTSTAHVRVNRILDGCVLREHYEDNADTVGESFTTYDVGRKLWHQTWVTNRGRLLTIEGGAENGAIVLTGSYYREDGHEVRVRGTWTPMRGSVRESAVTSSDRGKTWQPWFDLSFRPRVQTSKTDESDEATIARLDDEFQAAVKANDAETMAKIMADDFVLVTGWGRVFDKQQSLEEARNRIATYEHREDTQRTVRVWGNTAAVTAKLWVKGVREGNPIDYTLWFSDTYVRTPSGWQYVFGQASLPLPKTP